jgi:histidine phosphotransferase ChpT
MTDRMDDAALDFASLLCSRLCHDLLNPVGAIGNGLELLVDEQDPGLRRQYLELVADSVAVAQARLKYYRLAFGAAGSIGERLAAAEVRGLIEALAQMNGKLVFGWMADDAELPRGAIRILLNLTLIALDALVRGGRLDIAVEAGEIVVRAEGPRLVLDGEIRAALEGGLAAPTARASAAWRARALAERESRDLRVAFDSEMLVLGVGAAKVRG